MVCFIVVEWDFCLEFGCGGWGWLMLFEEEKLVDIIVLNFILL